MKKYNKVLTQMLIRHRSFEKLEQLQQNHDKLSAAEFQLMFNNWDKEVTQLMLGSEKWCNKFRDGNIEFSPVVGIWIRRLQAYRWIEQYHAGKVKHAGNLCRTCQRLGTSSPQSHCPAQILAGIEACTRHLADLKKIAPQLQNDHLQTCLASARDRGDGSAIKTIQNILRTESIRR